MKIHAAAAGMNLRVKRELREKRKAIPIAAFVAEHAAELQNAAQLLGEQKGPASSQGPSGACARNAG